MMMLMKWTGAAFVPVFVLSTFVHSALPLAHHFGSSSHPHLDRPTCPPSPQVKGPSGSDHDPDSCTICRILASVQPGDVQTVSIAGDWVSTVEFAPVVSTLAFARGVEITSASPRSPPFPLQSIQG
jgi:hypothetical protein